MDVADEITQMRLDYSTDQRVWDLLDEVERLREAVGGLTANVKRWRGRASAERLKRQRWRKRALAAEAEVERLRAELRRFQRIIIDASEVDADCEDLCGVLCAGPCHGLDEIAAISQDAGLDELTGEPPIRRPYPLVGPHQGDL